VVLLGELGVLDRTQHQHPLQGVRVRARRLECFNQLGQEHRLWRVAICVHEVDDVRAMLREVRALVTLLGHSVLHVSQALEAKRALEREPIKGDRLRRNGIVA